MGKTVIVDEQEITLPDEFIWILFRHGDKTNKSPTRGGELTPLGRKQVWDTTWQLIEKFGQKAMNDAAFYASPVYRVRQSSNIALAAIGLPAEKAVFDEKLEWGPNNGHDNDQTSIKFLIYFDHTERIKVALGHNGLWENVANIIHPIPGGYSIDPGEAFILTQNGLEVIRPRISA